MEIKEPSDSAYSSVSRSHHSGSTNKSQHSGSNTSSGSQTNITRTIEVSETSKVKTNKNSRKRNYGCLVFPEESKEPWGSHAVLDKKVAAAEPAAGTGVSGVGSSQSKSEQPSVRKRYGSSSLAASAEQRLLQTAAITRVLEYLQSSQRMKGSKRSDSKEGSLSFSFKSILSDPARNFYKKSFAYLNDLPAVQSKKSFVAAVSLQDGVVTFVTPSLTDKLGFPPDMWLGRFLLDFLHPKDRLPFTNQITASLLSGLNKDNQNAASQQRMFIRSTKTVCCRFRRYRGLTTTGFGIVDKSTSYLPFALTLSMDRIAVPSHDDENAPKDPEDEENYEFFLIVEATLMTSAYTQPKEKPVGAQFNLRHTANCQFSQVDLESVPYLGHLPQDLLGASVFDYYHPDDLPYLKDVYSKVISKQGKLVRSKPYSFRIYNGCYILLETDWTCFVNPWTRKVEFVAGQHRVLEGPSNPDVFASPQLDTGQTQGNSASSAQARKLQEEIRSTLTGSSQSAFRQACTRNDLELQGAVSRRRKELALLMGSILGEMTREKECCCGCSASTSRSRGLESSNVSILAGISSHHGKNGLVDMGSSSSSPLSYSQLNYSENLERFFQSQPKMSPSEGSRDGMQIILDSGASGSDQDRNPNSNSDGSTELQNRSMSQSGNSDPESEVMRLTEGSLAKHNKHEEDEFKKSYRGRKGCNYLQKRQCQQGVKRAAEISCQEELIGSRIKYAHVDIPLPSAGAKSPPTPGLPLARGRASLVAAYEGSATRRGSIFPINLDPPFSITSAGVSLPGTVFYSFPPLGRSGASAPVTTVTVTNSVPGSLPTYYLTPAMGSTEALPVGNHTLSCYPFKHLGHSIVYQPTLVMQTAMFSNSVENDQAFQQRAKENDSRSGGAVDTSCTKHKNCKKDKRNESDLHSRGTESSRSAFSGSQSSMVHGESIFSLASSYSQVTTSQAASPEDQNRWSTRTSVPVQVPRKTTTPPWMQTIKATREHSYQYQVPRKELLQTLSEDRARLEQLHQSDMINEQLRQLYQEMDEGKSNRNLGWDETETTASSSSGAEEIQNACTSSAFMNSVIYEENAPISGPATYATLQADASQ